MPARRWSGAPAPIICRQPKVPPDGATFPANAVAFRLNDVYDVYFSLETEDGNAVPASAKRLATAERVFSPDVPLDPGRRYVLRYDPYRQPPPAPPAPTVPPAPPAPPSPPLIPRQRLAFLTTEPLPFPPSAGTLSVLEEGVMDTGTGARIAFVKLQLVETPDSQPFRALRTHWVEVDDRAKDFGSLASTLGKSPGEIIIRSRCPESTEARGPCGDLMNLAPGRHRVKVTAQVLGAPSGLSPLEQEIVLSCGEDGRPSNLPPSPAPVIPPPDAGPAEPATAPASPAACAFAPGRRASGAVGFVLGLLALGLLRRRSNRHRRG
jgi:hypothetical protein